MGLGIIPLPLLVLQIPLSLPVPFSLKLVRVSSGTEPTTALLSFLRYQIIPPTTFLPLDETYHLEITDPFLPTASFSLFLVSSL